MKLIENLMRLLLLAAIPAAFAEEKIESKTSAPIGLTTNSTSQVIAYYFHGTIRCETCLKIEKQARETIEARFQKELATNRLVFASINYEQKENSHFQQEYKLPFPSLVLVRQENGVDAKRKLLGQTWTLVEDRAAFDRYVEKQVAAFLSGSEIPPDDTVEPISETAPGTKVDSIADLNAHFRDLKAALVFVHATNETSAVDWMPLNAARRMMESEWEIPLGLFELQTTASDYRQLAERFHSFRLPTIMVMLQNGSATMLSGSITESNLIQEFRYSVGAAGCCPFGEP
jgi:thiol-disulfide isomerase/thioredoxin